jgi:BirA family biotin operon repressor/biotin-[acetyl-CoA-carboxylase] ligase
MKQDNAMKRVQEGLDPTVIGKLLKDSIFSQSLVFHEILDSTNTLAKKMAGEGAPEGTVVFSEVQTRGRGRMDRQWISPGYVNLMFSVILRPDFSPERIFDLTVILSLATLEEIKTRCGCQPVIKWPNDLYLGDKKLAGILSEFSLGNKGVEFVVLGQGLNVNWHPGSDDPGMRPSTSLYAETGKKVDRNELLAGILKRLDPYYQKVLLGDISDFYKRWNHHSAILGREIEIVSAGRVEKGRALRIDQRGALIIRDNQGQEKTILAGDVSIRF